jgi:hypothetical protein
LHLNLCIIWKKIVNTIWSWTQFNTLGRARMDAKPNRMALLCWWLLCWSWNLISRLTCGTS